MRLLGVLLLFSLLFGIGESVLQGGGSPGGNAGFFDPEVLKIDESKYLGKEVPNINIVLENGKIVRLYQFLGKKPSIIIFTYYTCRGSCPVLNRNFYDAVKPIVRDWGEDQFNILTLSFDKDDTLMTLKKFKEKLVEDKGPLPKNWHFALMEKDQIKTFTGAVGFKFFYSRADNGFIHPNVVIFLDNDHRLTRYIYGIKPRERDLRFALVDAQKGKVKITSVNVLKDLLTSAFVCYSQGKYVIDPFLITGAIGMLLFLGVLFNAFFLYGRIYGKKKLEEVRGHG